MRPRSISGLPAMDFSFSPEQDAIRDTARRFAQDKLAPAYKAREDAQCLDRDVVAEMGALGLIAGDSPAEFGGFDLDSVSVGIIVEELSHGDMNAAYVQVLGSLIAQIIATHANEAAAREWVPKIVNGTALAALALTEPGGGSDAANLRLRAESDGDGGFILNGEKTSISLADQADVAVVFARTGGAGARGVSAFLTPLDVPGVSRTRFDDLGSGSVGRGSLFFDSVRVPAAMMLGEEGGGFRQVMQGFDYSRALIGLQCLGAARASLDETWAHVSEREAFGRPLAQFQGVSFPLAEAEARYRTTRLICFETLWRRDQGLAHTSEAAMSKWMGPKTSVDIIHDCLLMNGQMGYARDLPHQQRLRDVIGLEI
ncbi:MAG: cyclohexanecarboxyl-CoA dehydrogenase, partial [Rhodospirillaceae bacterium]|nr:cyclohexanecarboxyl-CoA dehydrogenase [Rhodospirillaceae bacterium]